jgi:ribonuclease J
MKIFSVGGFNEVGKNMTIVEVGEDAFIFDMGLYLPPIVELEEREKLYNEKKLRSIGALPDDLVIDGEVRKKVRAIFISHAHLDHVGAVPYMAERYNADIYATPFTIEVLKTIMNDDYLRIRNNLKVIQPNSSVIVHGRSRKYTVDFINITHSTVQTSMIALHTPEGVVLYANDFKFDNNPILGKKPNYEKLRELAKEGVQALILDSLYAGTERKTPSEKIARGLLEDVLFTTDNTNAAIFVTTFSSHIARLKSIVDFGKQLGRKIVFVGRSLSKYVNAAKNVKMCPFGKDIMLCSYRNQVQSILKRVNKARQEFLVVCTGHQGEPGSILERISRNEMPFRFNPRDHLIFSSKVIPTPISISNRSMMDKKFKKMGVRIFDEVHVSGHAGREDLRDFITMINPAHIIPAHGDLTMLSAMAELSTELGYKFGKECIVMQDGQEIKIAC